MVTLTLFDFNEAYLFMNGVARQMRKSHLQPPPPHFCVCVGPKESLRDTTKDVKFKGGVLV